MHVFKKEFWDAVLVKLVSILVSIKFWAMASISYMSYECLNLFTYLLKNKYVTSEDYANLVSSLFTSFGTVFGSILAIRGAMKLFQYYREAKESINGAYKKDGDLDEEAA